MMSSECCQCFEFSSVLHCWLSDVMGAKNLHQLFPKVLFWLLEQVDEVNQRRNSLITRMWANAQPDGRPAKHRWRPLFNAAKFG